MYYCQFKESKFSNNADHLKRKILENETFSLLFLLQAKISKFNPFFLIFLNI